MGLPMQVSPIKTEVSLRVFMGPQRHSWHNPPRLSVTVEVGRPSHWHGITSMGCLTHSCSHGYQNSCPRTCCEHLCPNERCGEACYFHPGRCRRYCGTINEITDVRHHGSQSKTQLRHQSHFVFFLFSSFMSIANRRLLSFCWHGSLQQQVSRCPPQVALLAHTF